MPWYNRDDDSTVTSCFYRQSAYTEHVYGMVY